MEGVACWGGFWQHYTEATILESIKKDESSTSEVTVAEDLMKMEMKAKGALMMTVSMVTLLELDALKANHDGDEEKVTAYIMWDHLKKKYGKRNGISLHTSFVDDGTLKDQLNHHLELRLCCTAAGFTISLIGNMLLISLLPSLTPTSTSWKDS